MENWKKTFAVIWSGQLASILSSSVVAFAIIFWVSLETGSAQVLALAAIAGMLPQSLLVRWSASMWTAGTVNGR